MKNLCVKVICGVFILFVITGCGKNKPIDEKRSLPVEVIKVSKGEILVNLFYVGDIEAKDQITVYSKAPGKLLENVVKEEDAVKKGDIIAYIDRDEVGFEYQKAPVESPIDGIVGTIFLDKGESVSPNTPVAFVVDMDTVEVEIDVVERDLPKIKAGQAAKITVDAYPDETFVGTVERVSPIVDTYSRTAKLEISIPNPEHRLKPGMFARTWIMVDKKEGILIITRDAIIREDGLRSVFVVKDGVAEKKIVELGLSEDNKFEAVSGVNEGDLVVTLGNTLLKEGDIVKITNRG